MQSLDHDDAHENRATERNVPDTDAATLRGCPSADERDGSDKLGYDDRSEDGDSMTIEKIICEEE